ncbi:unnamed protein product [Aphis gossypii]|uniref:Major facilitator superfamily (MFS) profile domain-containing protein n=1 Tax=Aphis gossypii TaxID=80765 RepID=A0A9P0J0I1_APHGO|nr:unnamed protein product [Aphis gossypii]
MLGGFFNKPVGRQYVAAFVASLSVMMAGTSLGWPSPVLAKLSNGGLTMVATNEQQSWMIAMLELGNLLSPIPFGLLVDKVGRKPCLLLTGPLYIVSWLMVLWSSTIGVLYWVRLLQGACIGIITTVAPIYIGEIAGDSIRGALSTFFNGMLNAGILYVYCVGPMVSYDALTYYSLLVPCAFLGTCLWIPESPYYYVLRDDDKKAHESVAWLHGDQSAESDVVVRELMRIKAEARDDLRHKGSMRDLFGIPVQPQGVPDRADRRRGRRAVRHDHRAGVRQFHVRARRHRQDAVPGPVHHAAGRADILHHVRHRLPGGQARPPAAAAVLVLRVRRVRAGHRAVLLQAVGGLRVAGRLDTVHRHRVVRRHLQHRARAAVAHAPGRDVPVQRPRPGQRHHVRHAHRHIVRRPQDVPGHHRPVGHTRQLFHIRHRDAWCPSC